MRLTSESAPFLVFFGLFIYFSLLHPGCGAKHCQKLCLRGKVCVCAHARMHTRSLARVYLSSRFPQCTIGPGGREGGRERDQKRVSHPADERVKVKAAPSQKKTSHGFLAHFFFFFLKSSKRREGNDTLSQSH